MMSSKKDAFFSIKNLFLAQTIQQKKIQCNQIIWPHFFLVESLIQSPKSDQDL